jgi:hypothetical protein
VRGWVTRKIGGLQEGAEGRTGLGGQPADGRGKGRGPRWRQQRGVRPSRHLLPNEEKKTIMKRVF